jgi:NAD(P)-dependent dehydrogenase (short-subunit alcohol dehydrogenase family)
MAHDTVGPNGRRFTGELIAVTGAGSGLGRAAAIRLAQEGGAVVCLDVDDAAASETAAVCGPDSWATACDITDEDAIAGALHGAEERAGTALAVLVANAGVAGPVGPVPAMELEPWRHLVDVNITGQVLCAKHAIPLMAQGGRGAIVFTASHVAFAAVAGWTPYAATKGAVVALARGLAIEHAPVGIRVNCVCPGPIETPLLRSGWAEANDAPDEVMESRGRVGRPEEIAAVIAFLASSEASLITGAALVADGGALAHMGTSWPSSAYWV